MVAIEIPKKYKEILEKRFDTQNVKFFDLGIGIELSCPLCRDFSNEIGCGECPLFKNGQSGCLHFLDENIPNFLKRKKKFKVEFQEYGIFWLKSCNDGAVALINDIYNLLDDPKIIRWAN